MIALHAPAPAPARAAAAALLILLAPAGAAADAAPDRLAGLLAEAGAWVAAHSDLPAPDALPRLEAVAPERLEALRYGTPMPAAGVEALYDDRTATIFVTEGWTGADAVELSVLIHEMVHHLQAEDGRRYPCPGAREALAYDLQAAWLEAHGSSLAAAFGLDPLTLLVRTTCTF